MKPFWALCLAALALCCCSGKSVDPDPGSDPTPPTPAVEVTGISGTFIQHWLVSQWSLAQWNNEMQVLAEAGMKYLVFTPLQEDDDAPDYDSLERCLTSAKRNGIKVFVGTNFHKNWWGKHVTSDWLNEQMQTGLTIAREAYDRFHAIYGDTLYGWYWDWEVDNLNWNSDERKSMLVTAMNISLDGLTALDAGMPLLFCPFFNPTYGAAKKYGEFWKSVFPQLHLRSGDIFAPQDCVGASGIKPQNVKTWFSQFKDAVATVNGLQLWADIELFQQFRQIDEDKFVTAPFERMPSQIDAVKSFVQGIICFAYTHYYSPNEVREDYHAAYKAYLKDGTLPSPGSPARISSHNKNVGTGVELSWTFASKTDIDGVAIYKNNNLLIKLQVKKEKGEYKYPDYFFDYDGKQSDTYQICTYNINGNESAKTSF